MIGFGLVSGFLLKKGLGIDMQKIIGVGLIVVLIVGMAWRIRAAGVRAGKAEAKLAEVETQIGEHAREQSDLATVIKEQAVVIAQAEQREAEHVQERQEWARMVQESTRALVNLQAQRQAIPEQIQRISDSDLAFTIKQTLGMRKPEDYGRPGYAHSEERALLQCLLDNPLCQKENRELGKTVEGLRGEILTWGKQVEDIHEQVAGLKTMLVAHRTYEGQLEGHYQGAVNALRRPRRKFYCLWLCKKKKTLTLPTLDELLQGKPATP